MYSEMSALFGHRLLFGIVCIAREIDEGATAAVGDGGRTLRGGNAFGLGALSRVPEVEEDVRLLDLGDRLAPEIGKTRIGGFEAAVAQLGRASCRERGCQYGEISVVAD